MYAQLQSVSISSLATRRLVAILQPSTRRTAQPQRQLYKQTQQPSVACSGGAAMAQTQPHAPKLEVVFDGLLPKNMEQLKMLNAALFPIKYQDGFYRECCAAGDVTQLAYHNDVLVGAIACRLELQPDFTAKMYIMTVGVLAPYRELGIGRSLMERSLAAAQKNPAIKAAYLHVQQTNEEAASFYKKFGFRESEVVKDYYKLKDGRDAVILSRSLLPDTPLEDPPVQQA